MAANVYEGMFILDSNRYGRDPEAVSGQIPAMIQKLGGEMLVSRLWEERRLAYPHQGPAQGHLLADLFPLGRQPARRPPPAVPDHRRHRADAVPEGRAADRGCPGGPRQVGARSSAPPRRKSPPSSRPAVEAVVVAEAVDAIEIEEER